MANHSYEIDEGFEPLSGDFKHDDSYGYQGTQKEVFTYTIAIVFLALFTVLAVGIGSNMAPGYLSGMLLYVVFVVGSLSVAVILNRGKNLVRNIAAVIIIAVLSAAQVVLYPAISGIDPLQFTSVGVDWITLTVIFFMMVVVYSAFYRNRSDLIVTVAVILSVLVTWFYAHKLYYELYLVGA